MLSYQHDYHAGNHADVLKHAVLALLISALQRKPAALRVIDSHAGSGAYDLEGPMPQRAREFETGAARILGAGDRPPSLAPYAGVLGKLNPGGVLRAYPGSPQIALEQLREQDRLELFELHPQAAAALEKRFGRNRQVHIHRRDGFEGLVAVVPPRERRGIALLDPSYERKNEFTRVAEVVGTCAKRWGNGVYAVWYPLIRHAGPARLVEGLGKLGLPRTFRVELEVAPGAEGLRGSGLVIANLPYRVDAELAELLPWLERRLGGGSGAWRAQWLG